MPSTRDSAVGAADCCAVLPTFNNAATLADVVRRTLAHCPEVIVVDDGSTDATPDILASLRDTPGLECLTYPDHRNRGKGAALLTGLRRAAERGFRCAVTLDTDGQHDPADIDTLRDYEREHPGCLVIGARNMRADGMPAKNTFANKFSNFWYAVQTLRRLPDTQSGFRLYPLRPLLSLRLVTTGYEFEIESSVRLAWSGCHVGSVPVGVTYAADRVSHFRPGRDFLRISLLNTVLTVVALLVYYPVAAYRWVRSGGAATFLDEHLVHSGESPARLASAVALGFTMSVQPIWGFQTLAAVAIAKLLRLNLIVVGTFTNASLPPLIPFIVFAGLHIGGYLLGEPVSLTLREATAESVGTQVGMYALGSSVLGALLGLLSWPLAWALIKVCRR